MKPAPFAYARPASVAEAVRSLDADGAIALAGGQSLMPLLNLRLARPRVLVDLAEVAGLDEISLRDRTLRLGAMVRLSRLERDPVAIGALPVLGEVLANVAHPEIRNRSTVGGSLCHLDPAAELPALAALLDASVLISGAGGDRRVPFADFALGAYTSSLRPGELVRCVELPLPPRATPVAFEEVTRRRGDFALAGALATRWEEPDGRRTLRAVAFGASPLPVRLTELEDAWAGGADPSPLLSAVGARLDPADEPQIAPEQRRRLVVELVRRCLERCGCG